MLAGPTLSTFCQGIDKAYLKVFEFLIYKRDIGMTFADLLTHAQNVVAKGQKYTRIHLQKRFANQHELMLSVKIELVGQS